MIVSFVNRKLIFIRNLCEKTIFFEFIKINSIVFSKIFLGSFGTVFAHLASSSFNFPSTAAESALPLVAFIT